MIDGLLQNFQADERDIAVEVEEMIFIVEISSPEETFLIVVVDERERVPCGLNCIVHDAHKEQPMSAKGNCQQRTVLLHIGNIAGQVAARSIVLRFKLDPLLLEILEDDLCALL